MRLFRHSVPMPPPLTIDAETDAGASSDALSELLAQLNQSSDPDTSVLPRQDHAIWLDSSCLLQQGKVHKIQILSKWIACQSYLTQAELEARERRSRMNSVTHGDEHTFSDATSRSGMTSRTSTSLSLTLPVSYTGLRDPLATPSVELNYARPGSRFSYFRKHSKPKSGQLEICSGLRYESFGPPMRPDLLQDNTCQIEQEWTKLNDAWRSSLHLAGPKSQTTRSSRKRLA